MQSSTRAINPVDKTILFRVSKFEGIKQMIAGKGDDLLCNVGDGVDDGWVADPHVTRRNPTASALVYHDLIRSARFCNYVRDWRAFVAISDQMEGKSISVLVHDTFPCILEEG